MEETRTCYVTVPVFALMQGDNDLQKQMVNALLAEHSDLGHVDHFEYQETGFSEEEQTVTFKVTTMMLEKKESSMTLQERLHVMPHAQLLDLFLDAETLHNTGTLPEDAPLRKITHEVFGTSMVLHMTTVSYNVYRKIALLYMYMS